MSMREIADASKGSFVTIALLGLTLASAAAFAKPKPNVNSEQDVGVYEVAWGVPRCSSFALSPVNGDEKIKDISNIVLSCGNEAGEVTWSKWEFDDETPYVFGTVLPDGLERTEGNGCAGAITKAYVKAGSIKTRKGLPGVSPEQFNGHLGGELACNEPASPPVDGGS